MVHYDTSGDENSIYTVLQYRYNFIYTVLQFTVGIDTICAKRANQLITKLP